MPFTTDFTVSTPAIPTTPVNATDITEPDGELLQLVNDYKNGIKGFDLLKFYKNTVTIASDAISLTNQPRYLLVDTEGAAAADNLATINGGSDGQIILLYAANAGRVVTMKHGTGNVKLSGNADAPLLTDRPLAMFFNGTTWGELGEETAMVINTKRQVVGASAASISISNIPATYKHLMLVLEMRTDGAVTMDNILIRFNADSTAANYYSQFGLHSATAWSSGEALGTTGACLMSSVAAGASAPANVNGIAIVYIPNYASAALQRALAYWGGVRGGTGSATLRAANGAAFWLNAAAAINQITLLPSTGANIVANSAYTLYGLN